ncbi:MAG: HAD family hydrolase [Chloroflexia bacterium]
MMPNANGRDGAVVVSFDLDGVIMQNPFDKGVTPHILGCLRASRDLLGLPVEEADRRGRTAIREAWGRRAASGEFVSCYDWDGIYEEVSRGFGGAPTPDVSELVRAYCEVDGMISLLPGARSGLERLRAAGLRVVAITNGSTPTVAGASIARCGGVPGRRAGGRRFAKPDPGLFEVCWACRPRWRQPHP